MLSPWLHRPKGYSFRCIYLEQRVSNRASSSDYSCGVVQLWASITASEICRIFAASNYPHHGDGCRSGRSNSKIMFVDLLRASKCSTTVFHRGSPAIAVDGVLRSTNVWSVIELADMFFCVCSLESLQGALHYSEKNPTEIWVNRKYDSVKYYTSAIYDEKKAFKDVDVEARPIFCRL